MSLMSRQKEFEQWIREYWVNPEEELDFMLHYIRSLSLQEGIHLDAIEAALKMSLTSQTFGSVLPRVLELRGEKMRSEILLKKAEKKKRYNKGGKRWK